MLAISTSDSDLQIVLFPVSQVSGPEVLEDCVNGLDMIFFLGTMG